MMHRTVLEELAEKQLANPRWEYVDAQSVDVRVIAPKWRWMVRVCAEIPYGKCVLFPVPKGMDSADFASHLRLSVNLSRHTNAARYSIRRTKDLSHVVVLKAETWTDYYKRLEDAEGLYEPDTI